MISITELVLPSAMDDFLEVEGGNGKETNITHSRAFLLPSCAIIPSTTLVGLGINFLLDMWCASSNPK
jgi:hypothetical protein